MPSKNQQLLGFEKYGEALQVTVAEINYWWRQHGFREVTANIELAYGPLYVLAKFSLQLRRSDELTDITETQTVLAVNQLMSHIDIAYPNKYNHFVRDTAKTRAWVWEQIKERYPQIELQEVTSRRQSDGTLGLQHMITRIPLHSFPFSESVRRCGDAITATTGCITNLESLQTPVTGVLHEDAGDQTAMHSLFVLPAITPKH